jgi:hypothetical protein
MVQGGDTMAIQERVPATVLRRTEGTEDYKPYLDVTALRFSGVLKHPVPKGEMLQKFGRFKAGCRIETRWPPVSPDDNPVRVGDRLEVAGHTYEIQGVKATPGICMQLYVDDLD